MGGDHHPAFPSPGRGICTSQAGSAACSGRWPWVKLLFLQLHLPGERFSKKVLSLLCLCLPPYALHFPLALWIERSAGPVAQQLPAGRKAGGPQAMQGQRMPPWLSIPALGAPSLQSLCPAGWGLAQQDGCEWNRTQGCASPGLSSGFPCAPLPLSVALSCSPCHWDRIYL